MDTWHKLVIHFSVLHIKQQPVYRVLAPIHLPHYVSGLNLDLYCGEKKDES